MAYFVPFEVLDGQTNMYKDECLLENAIKHSSLFVSKPILRLYGWKNPTLTIGRNQPEQNIDIDYCRENKIDVIRRITGGRAVLHDKELTYSFICHKKFLKSGNSVINSYKEISHALVLGFKKLGIELEYPEYKKVFPDNGYCMAVATGSDLSYKGKKLIGSAQCRKHDYILQHGSILLDLDKKMLKNVFCSDDADSEVTTLNKINKEIQFHQIINFIKIGFEENFSVIFDDIIE